MTDAPFSNCQFRECDLPGQCRSEGKCHHPRAAGASEGQAEPAAQIVRRKTYSGLDVWDIKIFDKDMQHGTKLYTHPSAEIAALRERIAGMEKDAEKTPVEFIDVERILKEGDGAWQSCSGCHETEDGHPVGEFPFSRFLKCELGAGCSECGGLGAVYHDWSGYDVADVDAAIAKEPK